MACAPSATVVLWAARGHQPPVPPLSGAASAAGAPGTVVNVNEPFIRVASRQVHRAKGRSCGSAIAPGSDEVLGVNCSTALSGEKRIEWAQAHHVMAAASRRSATSLAVVGRLAGSTDRQLVTRSATGAGRSPSTGAGAIRSLESAWTTGTSSMP